MGNDCKLAAYIILAGICALGWVIGGILSFLLVCRVCCLLGQSVLLGGLLKIVCFYLGLKFLACSALSIGFTVVFLKLLIRLNCKCRRLIDESIAESRPSIFASPRNDNYCSGSRRGRPRDFI